MDIFVSYSSKDRERVRALVRDLEEVGYGAWFDQELTGGQDWWDRILHQIQTCDVFLIALSENWVMSGPCALECSYAQALNRPILPVRIEQLSPETLPAAVQRLQLVDYHTPNIATLKKLLLAVNQLPPAAPIPDPLPAPPPVPVSPLARLAERLQATRLGPEEQRDILTRLRLSLEENPVDRELVVLLERLIKHPDTPDELVVEAQALHAAYQPRPTAPAVSKYPPLKPKLAPQIKKLAGLSYFVLRAITGGVSVHCKELVFSQDGQLLAVGYHEQHEPPAWLFRAPLDTLFGAPPPQFKGTIALYDIDSRKALALLKRPDDAVADYLSFAPDRRLLAAVYGYEIGIWDIALRRITQTLTPPDNGHVRALAFSPEGGLLVAQVDGNDSTAHLHLWDTGTWHLRKSFELSAVSVEEELEHPAFYFWPDGHRLLFLAQGEIHEANLRSLKSQRFAHSPDVPLQGLFASTPGGYLVLYTAQAPPRLLICRPEPWEIVGQFNLDFKGIDSLGDVLAQKTVVQRGVSDLALTPSGDLLAIITNNFIKLRNETTITLWDTARKRQKNPSASLKTGLDVKRLAFSPDGGLLVMAGYDQQVTLWGVKSATPDR